jgi:hypothetical protein
LIFGTKALFLYSDQVMRNRQEGVMVAKQRKPEQAETPPAEGATPTYKVQPQKTPDWSSLQAEVTAQFSQTIAYLAK